jgi:hypothetical protein
MPAEAGSGCAGTGVDAVGCVICRYLARIVNGEAADDGGLIANRRFGPV